MSASTRRRCRVAVRLLSPSDVLAKYPVAIPRRGLATPCRRVLARLWCPSDASHRGPRSVESGELTVVCSSLDEGSVALSERSRASLLHGGLATQSSLRDASVGTSCAVLLGKSKRVAHQCVEPCSFPLASRCGIDSHRTVENRRLIPHCRQFRRRARNSTTSRRRGLRIRWECRCTPVLGALSAS